MRSILWILFLFPAGPAFALGQPSHQDVAVRACHHAGLPTEFCLSVGRADYDTDAESWTDPTAHAQTANGGSRCPAADATRARLRALGGNIRQNLARARAGGPQGQPLGDVARELGRALHTLQDACAHEGMTNLQHAWMSDTDVCAGTRLSPDIQTAALDCAEQVTDEAIEALVDAVAAAGFAPGDLGAADRADWTRFPKLGEVCDFMESSGSWDGVDRRWDNRVVLPALSGGFRGGLAGQLFAPSTLCPHGEADIALLPAERRDVSRRAQCAITEAFCLGAEPTRTDVAPPFYNYDGLDGVGKGCTIGRRGGSGALLVIAALAILFSRRRRW